MRKRRAQHTSLDGSDQQPFQQHFRLFLYRFLITHLLCYHETSAKHAAQSSRQEQKQMMDANTALVLPICGNSPLPLFSRRADDAFRGRPILLRMPSHSKLLLHQNRHHATAVDEPVRVNCSDDNNGEPGRSSIPLPTKCREKQNSWYGVNVNRA